MWPGSAHSWLRVAASQISSPSPAYPDASLVLSGDHAKAEGRLLVRTLPTSSPLFGFQSWIVSSRPPMASIDPSGDHAKADGGPPSLRMRSPPRTSQILTLSESSLASLKLSAHHERG